jgi:hypothetical protein
MPRGRPRKNADGDVLVKSAELLGWALGGLEREIAQTRERLSSLTAQATKLRERIGVRGPGRPPAAAAAEGTERVAGRRARRRRGMSAEARKRMSEMMKKRWAERRKAKSA